MLGLLREPAGANRMTKERLRAVLQELEEANRITEWPKRGAWPLGPFTDYAVPLSLR